MDKKTDDFISSLTRDNIKVMKTAYENLAKNVEVVKSCQGKYYGNDVEDILGISREGVEFLRMSHLLDRTRSQYVDDTLYVWYLADLFGKLSKYKWLYEKEDERFELRFKLYKIFNKKNFEAAFLWVYSSPKSEWDKKLRCIQYNCNVMGCESNCKNTLEDAKKLYELLNN